MSWHSYEKIPNPINATDLKNFYENEVYIKEMLVSLGYTVDTLNDIAPLQTSPYKAIKKFYDDMELNLDIISDNDCESAYYIKSVKRGNREPSRSEWQRWLDVLNDMYNIVNGNIGKWQYLLCADGYPTIDGNRILLRGDKING